jgi:hypothetical protein
MSAPISFQAQRALDSLPSKGRLIRSVFHGITTWRVAEPLKDTSWQPNRTVRTVFMSAAIEELISRGLVVWDGPGLLKRPE